MGNLAPVDQSVPLVRRETQERQAARVAQAKADAKVTQDPLENEELREQQGCLDEGSVPSPRDSLHRQSDSRRENLE